MLGAVSAATRYGALTLKITLGVRVHSVSGNKACSVLQRKHTRPSYRISVAPLRSSGSKNVLLTSPVLRCTATELGVGSYVAKCLPVLLSYRSRTTLPAQARELGVVLSLSKTRPPGDAGLGVISPLVYSCGGRSSANMTPIQLPNAAMVANQSKIGNEGFIAEALLA